MNTNEMFDDLSSGNLAPQEAYKSVRSFLREHKGEEPTEQVYEAVRSVVWQIVSSRESGEHVLHWQDSLLKIRQLVRRQDGRIAERFTALADLLGQSVRFREVHGAQDLRRRKHVVDILKLLAHARHPLKRKVLEEATALRTANLSRVLSNLASDGLIKRDYVGRDVEVTITAEGRKTYSSFSEAPRTPSPLSVKAPAVGDFLVAHWPTSVCGIGLSDELGSMGWDQGFRDILPMHWPSHGKSWSTSELRRCVAQDVDLIDEVVQDEVMTADGRTFRVTEHPGPDGIALWFSYDVTEYRRRLDIYERRERALKSELDSIRRHFAIHELDRGPLIDEDPLQVLTAVRRDVLSPVNAICYAASTLRHSSLVPLGGEAEEVVTDIYNFANKIRDVTRALVKIGQAKAHAPLLNDPFNPDQLLRRVIDNLSSTLRDISIVVKPRKSAGRDVVGDELATSSALINALMGLSVISRLVSVERKVTGSKLQYDMFCAAPDLGLDEISTMHASLMTATHAIRGLGMDFRFNSSADGVNAVIVAPVKPAAPRESQAAVEY